MMMMFLRVLDSRGSPSHDSVIFIGFKSINISAILCEKFPVKNRQQLYSTPLLRLHTYLPDPLNNDDVFKVPRFKRFVSIKASQ